METEYLSEDKVEEKHLNIVTAFAPPPPRGPCSLLVDARVGKGQAEAYDRDPTKSKCLG